MLLFLLSSSIILCVLPIIGTALYQFFSTKWKYLFEIPGPKGCLVMGNIFDTFKNRDQVFLDDRSRAKMFYPIHKVAILFEAVVMITHPEDIERIMTSMKNMQKSFFYKFLIKWLGTGLLTSTGEKWRQRRKMLTPAFHFNILQHFLPIFYKETENLIDIFKLHCHEDSIEILPLLSEYTLLSINETAMGHKMTRNEKFQKYVKAVEDIGHLIMERAIQPLLYNNAVYDMTTNGRLANKLIKYLHDVSNQVIKEREKNFNRSEVLKAQTEESNTGKKLLAMLDLLLCAKQDGLIDHNGIREEVDTFMFEGHDTTSIALTFILLLLANHEKIQEEVFREIQDVVGDKSEPPSFTDLQNLNLMERCIKESLRLYPSVTEVSRTLGENVETISGHTIPAGVSVRIMILDLHRDQNIFPDPEKFDPDRFFPENTKKRHRFSFIPFSCGPRNCIGQKFAMVQLKAVLCGILKNFILKPVTKPEDLKFSLDIVMRPTVPVKIKFISRYTNTS